MQSICIHVFSVHVLFVQYAYILRELSGTESSFSLVLFSPVENENRKLEEDERSRYKKITAVLAVLFLVIYMFRSVEEGRISG